MSKDDRPINRRGFFLRGIRELLSPVADVLEAKAAEVSKHFAPLTRADESAHPPVKALTLLRPPGAGSEDDFTNACSRCGNCVKVCPADAIRIDPDGDIASGAPFINASVAPCIVCMGLECMTSCPTGALVPTRIADIDMGTARWNADTCIRTRTEAGAGQSACRICVDECPVGEVAIRVSGSAIEVIESGCIGCGVCQHRCPTSPKSIVVEPREAVLNG